MKQLLVIVIGLFLFMQSSLAARLAIVIDDFGYRSKNESQVIAFSPKITVAVLPNSSNAAHVATEAHEHGNEVIIHLPMAPMGKQPLEKDTLQPDMSTPEIHRIIDEAVKLVPYAIGVNNHMGSLMTSNLAGMQKVMERLSHYSLFFLDSRTIAKSQVVVAANEYHIPVLSRDVFLDDTRTEEAISHQFDEAIRVARRNGTAIAIGHPYPQTVNVLREKLAQLPDDIELVSLSQLLKPPRVKVTFKEWLSQMQTKTESVMFEWMIQKKSL